MSLVRWQRARRNVLKSTVKVPYRAILGDEADNIYAGDGYYWVRPYGQANEQNFATPGNAYRVRCGSALIQPRAGRVVWIGYGLDNRLTVLGFDHDDYVAAGQNPALLQPADPYRQWIRFKDIQNFRALPIGTTASPSMKVSVRQLFYYTPEGEMVRWNGTNAATHIDLTAYVPGADLQRYAVLWLRTYNPNALSDIQVTVSTSISSIDAVLSFTDLNECAQSSDPDTVPIQAFRLANAQTALKLDDAIDVDWRQFINMPQVFGFPNTVSRAYRIHEDWSVVAPSAVTVEDGGIVQIQDNALLVVLSEQECDCPTPTPFTSPLTTKGDVYTRTSSADARVAIGTIGQYFTPDTAASTGNKWDYATLDIAVTWGEDVSGSPNASVYQKTSDGKWYIANPVSSPPLISSRRGMILSTGASFGAINTAGVVRLRGPASGGSSLLANSPTYLLGAGTIGATPPTVTLDSTLIVVAMMGYALTTNSSYVQPYPTLTYRRYVTMSAGEEIDITHYSDITDKSRTARAFAIVYDTVLAEDYASSNQDAVLQLMGQSGAGAAVSTGVATGTNYQVGDVGDVERRQSQSLLLVAGTLTQITFTLRANSGSPSVGITVSLRADNAGIPATTSLYSTTVASPAASSLNTVTVTGGPFLAAGTYWLVFELSANQGTNVRYNMDGSAGSVYANGVSKADTVASLPFPGTWGTSNAGDLACSATTAAVALYDNIAQGVSHTGTPNVVTSIKLWLRRVGSSSDDLTVSLCADSAGSPGSTITDGTSNAVVMSTLGTSFAYVEFTYSVGARPSLSSGTQYWMKLSTTGSASNTVYVEVGTDNTSPSYANGQTKTDTGGTWSATSPASDSIFELYIQNDAFQEQLSIGQWSDPTTGQIGVRYGITFNNATDTQTSFKNNTDGTIIALLDVIMG